MGWFFAKFPLIPGKRSATRDLIRLVPTLWHEIPACAGMSGDGESGTVGDGEGAPKGIRQQGLQVTLVPRPHLLRVICGKGDEHFARAFADRPEHGAAGLLDPEIELQELPEHPWPKIDRDPDIEICSQA